MTASALATEEQRLRRSLLVGGATVVAAAMLPAFVRTREALADAKDDAKVLRELVKLELASVVCYDTALKSGTLSDELVVVAKRFRSQESAHSEVLLASLRRLDRRARIPRPPQPADLDDLESLETERAVLEFAVEFERMVIAAYYDAHQKIEARSLLVRGGQIVAAEGQQLVVLRQALEQDPLPAAFEIGEGSP